MQISTRKYEYNTDLNNLSLNPSPKARDFAPRPAREPGLKTLKVYPGKAKQRRFNILRLYETPLWCILRKNAARAFLKILKIYIPLALVP